MHAAVFVAEFGNDPKWDSLILENELLQQEKHRVGFAFWTWKENCAFGGGSWGVFDGVDCANARTAPRPSSGCVRRSRLQQLARVYPIASSDPQLTYHYDDATGAFGLRASGNFGAAATVVFVPSFVTGNFAVSGAVAGAPDYAAVANGFEITVFPGGGDYSITITPAPLKLPAPCVLRS